MKYWLRHSPLEVWVDVYRYPWISREKLGQIVDRFRNRKYAEYLQFYLHDWGKRTLKPILFRKQKGRPFKAIPQTPIPANIKCFEFIQISHFDQRIIAFLRQIQPLLVDIKFNLSDIIDRNLPNLRIVLANLVPLLDGTHSVYCNVRALPTIEQCFGPKLANINMIRTEALPMDEATKQTAVNFFMNWLPAPSNGPKWCDVLLGNNDNGFVERISTAIRQEFLVAKNPSTFCISVCVIPFRQEFVEFHLGNNIGEELHGVKIVDGYFQKARFTRYQANCGTELQEWASGIDPCTFNTTGQKRIEIENITIGSIDAMGAPENVEKERQKASTSEEA